MAAAPEGWAVSGEGGRERRQEELGSEATALKPKVQPGTLVWP